MSACMSWVVSVDMCGGVVASVRVSVGVITTRSASMSVGRSVDVSVGECVDVEVGVVGVVVSRSARQHVG